MLQITWFEFIVRGIPEAFLFVLAVYAFSKTKINIKKYLLSVLLFSISVYLIRLLPIQYGIHTILNLIALIILSSSINKIDIIKSIQGGIIIIILGFIFEGINAFFIQVVLKIDLNGIMNNPTLKTLYGLPSLLFPVIFVVIYYLRLSKRKELRYV